MSEVVKKEIVDVEISTISQQNVNPRKLGLIEENVKALMESEFFPEIHLGFLNGELIVVDGYHRLEATKRLGLKKIKAYITEYKTIEALKKDATNENVIHGVRLTDYDVAMSMFELFKSLTEKNQLMNTSIVQFIKYFNLDERRGRSLFSWAILHKEILEDDVSEVKKASNCEEVVNLLSFHKENYVSISNEIKYKIKQFYLRYGDLPRQELREAIKLYKENKDYLEEKKKEAKEIKEAEVNLVKEETKKEGITERAIEPKNDLLKEVNENPEATFQEKLASTGEQLEKEIKKAEKNETKKISISAFLDEISSKLMTLFMFQQKGKLEDLTKDHIDVINNIQDRLEELTAPYYEKLNQKQDK